MIRSSNFSRIASSCANWSILRADIALDFSLGNPEELRSLVYKSLPLIIDPVLLCLHQSSNSLSIWDTRSSILPPLLLRATVITMFATTWLTIPKSTVCKISTQTHASVSPIHIRKNIGSSLPWDRSSRIQLACVLRVARQPARGPKSEYFNATFSIDARHTQQQFSLLAQWANCNTCA